MFLVTTALEWDGGSVRRVHGGRASSAFAITSFTSRFNTGQHLSSVLGNSAYSLRSFRSSRPDPAGLSAEEYEKRLASARFKNFSFKVTDPTQIDQTKGRFYFEDPPRPDLKELIRFHDGNRSGQGTRSAGCLVHFSGFHQMRVALARNQHGLTEAAGAGKLALWVVSTQADDDSAQKLWDRDPVTSRTADWIDAVRGTVWLVRPDEPPVP